MKPALPRAILFPKKFRWWPWAGPALKGVKTIIYDHEKSDDWCMPIPNCECTACSCTCPSCWTLRLENPAPEVRAVYPPIL